MAAGVQAVSGQLSHLLRVGDTFQLKTQLLSLSSSGIVDQFQLLEPGGAVVAGIGDKESDLEDPTLENAGPLTIRMMPYGLSLIHQFEILSASGQASSLIVAKKLHLEVFILLLLLQGFVFYAVHHIFNALVLKFASDLTNPIADLAKAVASTRGHADLVSNGELRRGLRYVELNQTLDSFLKLLARLQSEEKLRIKAEKDATLASVASHVAHDVRSPLAALNMAVQSLPQIPEDDRLTIRSALRRINDTANELLRMSRVNGAELSVPMPSLNQINLEPTMIVGVIDSLLSEKRMEFRDQQNILIEEDLSKGYGLFSKMPSSDLARVISNLVNNSVEAIGDRPGSVNISVEGIGAEIKLVIQDNGRGIPKETLKRLGEERIIGEKVGTDSGSGLGVRHAKALIERAAGTLQIQSEFGIGTAVTLTLPKADAPAWFVLGLTVQKGMTVVSVDDDQSVHQVWAKRLRSAIPDSLTHETFSTPSDFETWIQAKRPANLVCLIDFEFLGKQANGLDCIERMGISNESILVSSRYDDMAVRSKASALNVRMIPKGLAPFVPINIEKDGLCEN